MINERRGQPSRRESDFEPGQPWWVKSILQGVAPTAGVGFFIWWFTQIAFPLMAETKRVLTEQVLPAVAQVQAQQAEMRGQTDKLIYIGRVSCANAAKDGDARDRCLR